MKSKLNITKEVSCKALDPIFYYAKQNNVDIKNLIAETPYDINYFLNIRERIEWEVWCKIISNARTYFTPADFEKMGSSFIKSNFYKVGILPAFFLFSSNRLSRPLVKLIFQNTSMMFSCIKQRIEFVKSNRVKLNITISEDYELCPEFFYISKGYWGQLGNSLGHKNFNFEMSIKGNTGIFEASWNKEGILFKIKRGMQWIFNIRKALQELTETNVELLHQYQILQISKKQLQKQTVKLKTAYEISKSVRQGFTLIDTLKVITNTLVYETGFPGVVLKLNNDLNDKNINITIESGEQSDLANPILREIIIDNKNIGSILITANTKMDFEETNEILDFITPVINISIHDALVHKEVINYRDNLERIVTTRTYELIKAKDELAATIQLLQESYRNQNTFFTNISHEFRTPLTLILGPIKQILENNKNDHLKDKLSLIYRSANKLNFLVDELLDISKIESGEMKLNACPTNIVSAVKESAMAFYSIAERKKITFNINSEEEEIITYVDTVKFDKILNNLLSNAFKFTAKMGSVEVKINSTVKPTPVLINDEIKNGYAVISVSDTGIGISADQMDKIFNRFYQVDSCHEREYGGTGIGLSLTKELIELHKGKIEVESEEGKGSTFKLFFPLGKSHLKPEEVCEGDFKKEKVNLEFEESEKKESLLTKDIKHSNKPGLLIVEDNPDVRKFIIDILHFYYEIFEAKDGKEGLEKAVDIIPDLIIMDIMMPEMDGFQLCSKIKNDSRTSHIPVIMLTAKATIQDKILGLDSGADDYIMKPFDASELKARIKNLLDQRKRMHEHFRKYGLMDVDEKRIRFLDQKFLQNAIDIVSKSISDPSFNVEVLAEKLSVSRSLLLKKTDALFGETPSDLIRRIRLNKAAGLLEKRIGNISEIALEVGFLNPSYFSECFKKQFGVSPSQYNFTSDNS